MGIRKDVLGVLIDIVPLTDIPEAKSSDPKTKSKIEGTKEWLIFNLLYYKEKVSEEELARKKIVEIWIDYIIANFNGKSFPNDTPLETYNKLQKTKNNLRSIKKILKNSTK